MLPKALKSCPKSNKSPNLDTLPTTSSTKAARTYLQTREEKGAILMSGFPSLSLLKMYFMEAFELPQKEILQPFTFVAQTK